MQKNPKKKTLDTAELSAIPTNRAPPDPIKEETTRAATLAVGETATLNLAVREPAALDLVFKETRPSRQRRKLTRYPGDETENESQNKYKKDQDELQRIQEGLTEKERQAQRQVYYADGNPD